MITQRLMIDVNNHTAPDIFIRETERGLRQVVFIVTRKDDEGNNIEVDIPDGAVGQLRIVKPSRQFVIVSMNKTILDSGSTVFTATLPEQAGAVGGVGYYDVRISDGNAAFAFTAQGNVYIDDNVLNSGILEDISEVKGLVFPDDFLTKDEGAVIDDATISTDSTWSSAKISEEISNIPVPEMSDDYTESEKKVGTWFGKPLYRRIYTSNSNITSNQVVTVHSDPSTTVRMWDVYVMDETKTGLYFKCNSGVPANSAVQNIVARGGYEQDYAVYIENSTYGFFGGYVAIVWYTKKGE